MTITKPTLASARSTLRWLGLSARAGWNSQFVLGKDANNEAAPSSHEAFPGPARYFNAILLQKQHAIAQHLFSAGLHYP